MKLRVIAAVAAALLLLSLLVFGAATTASTSTSGTLTGWTGNEMNGSPYALLNLDSVTTDPKVTIKFSGSGSMATAYCGVTSGDHNPPTAQDKYAWIPRWGFDHTHAQGQTTVTLACTTGAILVAVMGAPAPALSVTPNPLPNTRPPGGATSTPSATAIPATNTPIPSTATVPSTSTPTNTATSIPTSTTAPSTSTPVPPTATPQSTSIPTGTPTAGDGGSTCTGAAGEVDQNGISVYVWASGKRTSCAGAGYENGDNPMPAGTHLPAPRVFNFDSAVVMHESPFGFKVYYRQGSEAPSGYGGSGGCGDVRVIMHQGGSTTGMQTQFHTVQVAMDQCDGAGVHHIIDIAGRIDTGTLFLRSRPDSERPANANRTTADTLSCNGTTTFICATVWYSFFNYALPGASNTGWSHMGFLIENPITLYDNANPANVHLTGNDGSTTMLRDNQFYVPAHSAASWTCLFNTVTNVNEVVSPGTAGAWQNYVDQYFSEVQRLEPSYGVDHAHPIGGLVFPN